MGVSWVRRYLRHGERRKRLSIGTMLHRDATGANKAAAGNAPADAYRIQHTWFGAQIRPSQAAARGGAKRIGMGRCVRRMREDTSQELVGPVDTAGHPKPRGTTRRLHLNRSKLIRKLDTSSIAIFGLAMVLRTVLHSDERSSTNGTRRALAVRDISSKRGMRSKQPRRTNRLTRSSGDVLSRRCIVLQR